MSRIYLLATMLCFPVPFFVMAVSDCRLVAALTMVSFAAPT